MTSEEFEEPLFDQFRINVKRGELWKAAMMVPLAPQAFSLLRVLYEHRGQVVSLGDLKRLVWKTDHVEKHNIQEHVLAVRKALDDLKGKYVQTVGSLGYILICEGTDFYSYTDSSANSFRLIVDGMIINSVAELLHDDNETRAIRPLCHASYQRSLEDFAFAIVYGSRIVTSKDFRASITKKDQPGREIAARLGEICEQRPFPVEVTRGALLGNEAACKNIRADMNWIGQCIETRRWAQFYRDYMVRESSKYLGTDDSLFQEDLEPTAYRFNVQSPYYEDRPLQDALSATALRSLVGFLPKHPPGSKDRYAESALKEFATRNVLSLITIIDPLGNKTIHTYDSALRIVQITDPTGKSVSYSYDANNDRTGVANQSGAATDFSYDNQGNIISITDAASDTSSFSYDSRNDLLTATSPKGNSVAFSYDGNGNLTKIVDALGDATTFTYDSYGELTSKKDAKGNTTTYAHDGTGDLIRITDALGHITSLSYDGIGRLTGITDPNGHAATAAYDALSRLVQIADPLGDTTQFAYDPVGNLLKVTDADGHATSYAYDATDNLISVTDALGHITQYAYDANNNRISFTNAKGNATSYAYDSLNRLIQITDPLSFKTSYSYDAVGNVVATTDAKGQTNRFAYDALSRLLSISYADGKNVTYSYDADGNRLSMTDSHGATTYAYDALDRLTSVTNPGTKIVSYSYDPAGNRQTLTYPDGKTVTYAYDSANRLAQVTDWLGRSTAYSYDPAGNLTETAYPNGTSSSLTYDAANRLTRIVNALARRLPLTLSYTLDGVGNRTSYAIDGVATQYSYDVLNELIAAQLGPLRKTWSYDAVGNRTQESSLFGPINYTYDADDRLLAAGKTVFAYDADGNQTSVTKPLSQESAIYSYDAANRLVGVTGSDAESTFAYDGDGNRISQSVEDGTYSYLNDVATALPQVLQESGPDGDISYTYGIRRVSETSTNFDYFYQYDGLGSAVTLSDNAGRPAAGYLYDAWGNSLLDIPNSVGTRNKFRFTGEALDPGTQLYYLRARYYDPSAGRFLSRDPFPGILGVPLTLNRYGYALANPVRYRDPSGMLSITGVLQWFTDFLKLTQSSENAYQFNQLLNQQGCLGTGNLENCTPQLQQQANSAQQQAIQNIGTFAASQPSTIYGGFPGASDLIWLWNSVKDLVTIPVANAQGLSSESPTASSSEASTPSK